MLCRKEGCVMVRVERAGASTRIEIFFHDLSEEARRALLEAYNVDSPEEMNWDVFPVDVLEVQTE